MGYNDRVDFSVLLGNTIVEIDNRGDELFFICADGSKYKMYHEQDCCESVWLEDVCGDFDDLLNSEVLLAEVVSDADGEPLKGWEESYTWTFYKLATIKGSVTLRWYGTSNGYYSESVDFEKVN